MAAPDVEAIVNKAIEIDPVAGNALKNAVQAGELGFIEFQGDPADQSFGVHDHDTLGINTDPSIPLDVQAVAALHEFEHHQHANTNSGGDARALIDPNDPWAGESTCFICTHASMSIQSFTTVNDFACDGAEGQLLTDLCDAARELEENAAEQSSECLARGCAGAPDPSWSGAVCPNCP
ncbi:MAG: hypothetical protein P1V81_16110 [Planctomycetota bacterium]|nr:hypothetical protein [Planctomycetota bacterium]